MEDGRIELYNLQDNIAESSSQNLVQMLPQKAREMKELLHSWREKMGVSQSLKKNPEFDPEARQKVCFKRHNSTPFD